MKFASRPFAAALFALLVAVPAAAPARAQSFTGEQRSEIERIVKDYADAAERMVAANLDGFELECYGHLIDNFGRAHGQESRLATR